MRNEVFNTQKVKQQLPVVAFGHKGPIIIIKFPYVIVIPDFDDNKIDILPCLLAMILSVWLGYLRHSWQRRVLGRAVINLPHVIKRYYPDFFHKYVLEPSNRCSFSAFDEKRRAKNQPIRADQHLFVCPKWHNKPPVISGCDHAQQNRPADRDK